MSEAACRQCGKTVSLDAFPTGEFVCPECGWRELMPNAVAQRPRSRRATHGGLGDEDGCDSATATLDPPDDGAPQHEPETAMETATFPGVEASTPFEAVDVDELGAMSGEDFTIWCARLLTRFGFGVTREADDELRECDLRVTRDGETIFVDCVSLAPDEIVDRRTCQRLVGAMVGGGARRGIVMTPGTCGDGCYAFVERLGGDYVIDFIGGARLEETVQEMMTGPLAVWWKG